MDSKKPNRRGFLKGGAAAAGLAVGAAKSAKGKLRPRWHEKGTSKEIIAYGERSRFVTSYAHRWPNENVARCSG